MSRKNRIRLSDREKAVLDAALESEFNGEVAYGTLIEHACLNLLPSKETEADSGVNI